MAQPHDTVLRAYRMYISVCEGRTPSQWTATVVAGRQEAEHLSYGPATLTTILAQIAEDFDQSHDS